RSASRRGGADEPGRDERFGTDRHEDRPDRLQPNRRRRARAGAQDFRRLAARPDRPRALHAERERLLLRTSIEGLRCEPRPARHARGVHASRAVAARRHDPPPLPREVPEQDVARLDVRNAVRTARAGHGGGGGVTPYESPSTSATIVHASTSKTFARWRTHLSDGAFSPRSRRPR